MSTVFICGGSNSVMRDGWVPMFTEGWTAGPVKNLSIGGSTSIMALFRLINDGTIQPGDTLIWEYALNEWSHITTGKHPQKVLLRMFEMLLDFCARKGVRILPVVMACWHQERMKGLDHYRASLHFLLRNHRVDFIDVNFEAQDRRGVDQLVREDFDPKNPWHYLPNGEIHRLVADLVAERLDAGLATVTLRKRLFSVDGRRIMVVDKLDGAPSERFKNALVDLQVYRLANGPYSGRFPGLLHAAIVIGTRSGQAFDLTVAGEPMGRFSNRTSEEIGAPLALVKQINFTALLGEPIPVRTAQLEIARTTSAEGMRADMHFAEDLEPDADANDAVVALMMEVPAAAEV